MGVRSVLPTRVRGKPDQRLAIGALSALDGGQDKLRAVGARRVVTDADFSRFRQVADTPFNLVYEVRP